MNVFSSLNVGVAGLHAQSTALDNISQNVSNADTVGYKEGLTTFADLVSDTSANNYSAFGSASPDTGYSPSGAVGTVTQLVDVQGNINPSSSPTDLAISGPGFFAVSPTATDSTANLEFTRAGSFIADANGNYANAAGLYLLGFPIDAQGNLPSGVTGSVLTDGAVASLQPVNIQKVITTPVATTNASIEANLDASQTVYPGASDTVTMDANDPSNSGINANAVIVPTGTDSIIQGDTMTLTTAAAGGAPASVIYTYGGIAVSRSATNPAINGSSNLPVQSPSTLATNAIAFNSATPTSMTINLGAATPASLGITAATVVSLAGTAGNGLNVNNITSLDGNYYVSGIGANSITVTIPSNITPPSATTLNGATFTATTGQNTISVSGATIPAGMQDGDTVVFSNIPGIDAGMTSGVLNNPAGWVVSSVNAGAGTFTITTTTTDTAAGAPVAGGATTTMFDTDGDLTSPTATVSSRLFTGDILDANTPILPLINTPSNFTSSALSFTITTPSTGTSTFTYTSGTPDATNGGFSNLSNLAIAISDVKGLTARVVNNQLYIADVNGNDSITFANGSTAGSNTSPPLGGIDWVNELGLANVGSGTNRFSTMQGLADDVNSSTTLTATVKNPLSASTVKINADDPLATLTLADGGGNTGSLLGALGLAPSLNGGAFVAPGQTAGPFGPSYNAALPASNMASGNVIPDFTVPLTVVDNTGANQTLNVGFLKTGANSWSVEIYSNPASAVTAIPAGQVAAGTVTFNSDSTLASISPSLTQVNATWTDGAAASPIAFNFGTAGIIGIGKSDGLEQFASPNKLTSVQQNGIPPNTATTVSVTSGGLVTATYSNGNTRGLYQIPLAEFTNPEALNVLSGNAYTQSAGSGTLSFIEPAGGTDVSLTSNALESSNVDLATQLTNMIIAQNAYQANTKLISASDQMLQTAVQMDQSVTI